MLHVASSSWLFYFVSWLCSQHIKRCNFAWKVFTFFLCVKTAWFIYLPLYFALKYWPLSLTGSMLGNGVSDFESKPLTMHSTQNSQQNRNAAKSLSRSTAGPQFLNLGIENVPLSTNKKLGKSEAYLWEKTKTSVFLAKEGKLSLFPQMRSQKGSR